MKRSRRSKIALLLVMCMMLMVMPILANGEVIIQKTDLVGEVFNLSATTHKNKTFVIPSTINEIVINGGSAVMEGLNITAASRTTPLKVTIKNVHITKGNIDIASTAGTTLVIEGVNKIQNDSDKAAITVQPGGILTIEAENIEQELTAIGGPNGGAGIGGNVNLNNGTGDIVIKNGKIIATGNGGGAGIGQGYQANGSPNGNITISGGIISAQAQNGIAAGIGGGNNSPIGDITISGGIITATGANGGAGIGAGSKQAKDIEITGGAQITATGNGGGAGIGGGNGSEAIVNNITINNATIEAYGGTVGSIGGAGIGGGNQSSFNILTISESTGSNTLIEEAIGGYGAAGIGTGSDSGGGGAREIIIDGGTIVEAVGGAAGAGIGGGNKRGCKITITGTALIKLAQGGSKAAGIGSGPEGEHNLSTTISGGKIEDAIGGEHGAGIGGGETRGHIIVITGGYIENAQGGKYAAGIGGGMNGQEGSITMSGGIVYAQAGVGADNAIGAGEYPTSDQEEKVLKFTVSGGDVFLRGDAKGFIPGEGYIKVGFKLYSNWVNGDLSASTVHVDKDCLIREVIPNGVGEDGKKKYDLVFNSNDGQSNSNGIINAILRLPNYDTSQKLFDASKMEVGDFSQLDNIFHGYWFQYAVGDEIMIGKPAISASKAGWNIVFEQKKEEKDGKTEMVDDCSKLIEMTIPIKFEATTPTPEPISIGTIDNSQSKVVPYSVSNLSFMIPTAGVTNLIEVKDLTVEINFSNITSKIECEKAKITWGVWDKGNYSNTLTAAIKTLDLIQDNGSKKLKLTYPASMLKTDDFVISLFIPTEHFETDASKNQEIDIYKDTSDANHKLGKKEDVTVTIYMKAKVVTKEAIEIPGITEKQYVPGQKVIDVPEINKVVKMEYADFTKIN